MRTFYEYVTGKCKEKQIKIEALHRACGLSRSTMYRYLKGYMPLPEAVSNQLSATLQLDAEEHQELLRLAQLASVDKSLLAARQALDDFLFGIDAEQVETKPVEFVLYDRDRFLRSDEEIFDSILDLTQKEAFRCQVRIINCLLAPRFKVLLRFIERLFQRSPQSTAEQLIGFAEEDYEQTIRSFLNILPLLNRQRYKPYYRSIAADQSDEDSAMFFEDTLLIEVHYREEGREVQRFYLLSYLPQSLSQCIVFEDEYFYRFWDANYQAFKNRHRTSKLDKKSIDLMGEWFFSSVGNTESVMLKPDMAYIEIPQQVYQRLFQRLVQDKTLLSTLMQELMNEQPSEAQLAERVQNILAELGRRTAYTQSHRTTMIHSMPGLKRMVETGRISDHLDLLPSFDREEIRVMLQSMRQRHLDGSDGYRLVLLEEEILQDGYILCLYKEDGVFVEFDEEQYRRGIRNTIRIHDATFSDILWDYVENHLIAYGAVPEARLLAFLDELIESLSTC